MDYQKQAKEFCEKKSTVMAKAREAQS